MRSKHQKEKKSYKKIIIIVLSIIIVISVLFIIYNLNKDKKLNKEMDNLIDNIQVTPTAEKTEMMLKLEELQKNNSEIVAWIEISGTNINYPVLQTENNDYYMTHDYKKEYSKNGSIFLDKDYDWNIPSSNLLLYGHNNKNGTMFQDLQKYKEENFCKEHPTIKLTTNKEDVEYEIIAVFLSRVYYKSETDVFRYYYFINAENEEEYNEYVANSKKASLYDTGKTAEYGDQLLTLSTCSYHTEDGRLAIVARKIK
ncbi:MAG: class B sortase [Clostridia bacterium]|nr:class B sortase [Clostridia bacterium]